MLQMRVQQIDFFFIKVSSSIPTRNKISLIESRNNKIALIGPISVSFLFFSQILPLNFFEQGRIDQDILFIPFERQDLEILFIPFKRQDLASIKIKQADKLDDQVSSRGKPGAMGEVDVPGRRING